VSPEPTVLAEVGEARFIAAKVRDLTEALAHAAGGILKVGIDLDPLLELLRHDLDDSGLQCRTETVLGAERDFARTDWILPPIQIQANFHHLAEQLAHNVRQHGRRQLAVQGADKRRILRVLLGADRRRRRR